jgi:hypothetical protein
MFPVVRVTTDVFEKRPDRSTVTRYETAVRWNTALPAPSEIRVTVTCAL